jgi:hypothetical protein
VSPYLKKTHHKKRAGGVAQDVGTEFKPQYRKQNKTSLDKKEKLLVVWVEWLKCLPSKREALSIAKKKIRKNNSERLWGKGGCSLVVGESA